VDYKQLSKALARQNKDLKAEISRYERKRNDYSDCYGKLFDDFIKVIDIARTREAGLLTAIEELRVILQRSGIK